MNIEELELENKIKSILKDKGVSIKHLCENIDMTNDGLNTSLRKNTIKLETLMRIANFLQVPISYFFTFKSENIGTQNYYGDNNQSNSGSITTKEFSNIKQTGSFDVESIIKERDEYKSERDELFKKLLEAQETIISLMKGTLKSQ